MEQHVSAGSPLSGRTTKRPNLVSVIPDPRQWMFFTFLGPFQLGLWKKREYVFSKYKMHTTKRLSCFFSRWKVRTELLFFHASKNFMEIPTLFSKKMCSAPSTAPRCVLWSDPSTGHPSNLCKHAKCRRSQRPQSCGSGFSRCFLPTHLENIYSSNMDHIYIYIYIYRNKKKQKGAFFRGEIDSNVSKAYKKQPVHMLPIIGGK